MCGWVGEWGKGGIRGGGNKRVLQHYISRLVFGIISIIRGKLQAINEQSCLIGCCVKFNQQRKLCQISGRHKLALTRPVMSTLFTFRFFRSFTCQSGGGRVGVSINRVITVHHYWAFEYYYCPRVLVSQGAVNQRVFGCAALTPV